MVIVETRDIDVLLDVHRHIPELAASADKDRYQQRLAELEWLGLVAYENGQLVGFKLGYGLNPLTFYSWLGGVVPAYRRSGVAQQLLDAQEQWAKAQGYDIIEVKTRGEFSAMQAFLQRNQYGFVMTYQSDEYADERLIYRKRLV